MNTQYKNPGKYIEKLKKQVKKAKRENEDNRITALAYLKQSAHIRYINIYDNYGLLDCGIPRLTEAGAKNNKTPGLSVVARVRIIFTEGEGLTEGELRALLERRNEGESVEDQEPPEAHHHSLESYL